MPEAKPEVTADILVFNAVDYTRGEIAEMVNEEHDADLSSRDVGEIINNIEDEARDGDEHTVVARRVGAGFGKVLGEEAGIEMVLLRQMFADQS